MLRTEATREQVQLAVTEQQTVVTNFVALLLKEEERQGSDGKPSIVITGTQCKP